MVLELIGAYGVHMTDEVIGRGLVRIDEKTFKRTVEQMNEWIEEWLVEGQINVYTDK